MSEYTYYEFRSIDRPLTKAEQDTVSSWSSRTRATPYRAVFTYSYSDLSYGFEDAVRQYFDVGITASSYGSRRLAMRLPRELVDYEQLRRYIIEGGSDYHEELAVTRNRQHVIVSMSFDVMEESNGWIEDKDMAVIAEHLIALRQRLLDGDCSPLMAMYLKVMSHTDSLLPDHTFYIPANLSERKKPNIAALLNFLVLDDTLYDVAQQISGHTEQTPPDFADMLDKLPEERRLFYLTELLDGKHNLQVMLRQELLARYDDRPSTGDGATQIRLSDYLDKVAAFDHQKKTIEANRAKAAHSQRMAQVAKERDSLLRDIHRLIEEGGKSATYDKAIYHLCDLDELAVYEQKTGEFRKLLDDILDTYSRKSAMTRRIKNYSWKSR